MTDDREAALLAAVQADPADLQARGVYADWLEERGDPRGEYLRLDLQLHTVPARLMTLVDQIDPHWCSAVNGRFRITITGIGPNKIAAIKVVRELTGLGLKDAKDFVERVADNTPEVLVDDIPLEDARRAAAKCESEMTVRIEPRLPPLLPIAPRVLRVYRVVLAGIADRLGTIRALHERHARPVAEARAIADRIAAGECVELAVRVDATNAAEIAVALGAVATVRIERA